MSALKYGKRHRVLIVEDDTACAVMYQRALRLAGFDVDLAEDGLTALELLERRHPDLIVLDLHLPRLRGESVLEEVAARDDLRHISVIVVSGSDAQAPLRADAILRKPCDPERLVAIVVSQLDRAA